MNLDEIKDLIRLVSKTGVNKVSIEREGFKLNIVGQVSKENQVLVQAAPQPMMAPTSMPQAEQSAPQAASTNSDTGKSEDSNYITVKSPMIGTFYRSPGPDKDPFVGVGSVIKEGDKLCIIEAMKTFNEIESEVTGKIIKVLIDDSSPVDYDQPLFLVDPS